MRFTRALKSAAVALLLVTAVPLVTTQSASAKACGGQVSGSFKAWGTRSVQVRGAGCSTRWAHLTLWQDDSCCNPLWVRIERQLWGSYGWLTANTKTSGKIYWNNSLDVDTAGVPYSPGDGQQRFHACYGTGDTLPTSWLCGGWVS
ncbi:hypothetical protein GCM10009555_061010 [Acrocarpospora macrocephala]|nr:hypothetical protein [Acrocarpospora macrocephala]